MNVIFAILFILALLIFIIASFIITVLCIPVHLSINTLEKIYLLKFPGGRISYQEIEGVKGIEVILITKRNFYSFREIFRNIFLKKEKKKEEGEEKAKKREKKIKKLEKEKEKNQLPKEQNWREILGSIMKERELIKKVIASFLSFLVDSFRMTRVELVEGTFTLGDPYYNGLCSAVLCSLSKENFRFYPNFEDKPFYLRASVFIVPARVVWRFLRLVLSLPLLRIYNLYKILKWWRHM